MEDQQSRGGPIGNRAPASRRTTPDWKSIFRQPTPKQGVGSNKQRTAAALPSSAGGPPATPTPAAARAPALFTSTPPPSSPLLFGTHITPPASPLLFGTPPPPAPTLPPATTPGSASASKVPQGPRPTVVVVLPHWMPPELKPGPPGPEPGATPPQLLQALEAARTAGADLFSSSSSGSSAARKLAGVTAPEPQAGVQHAPLGPPNLKPAHHWAPSAAAAAARLRQPAFDEDCHSEDSTRAASVSRGQLQQWQGTAAAAAAGGRGSWPGGARGSSGGGGVESMATSVTTGRLPGNYLRQQPQQPQQQRQGGSRRAASTADTTTTGGGSSSKAAQRLASCMEQLALLQQQANTLF